MPRSRPKPKSQDEALKKQLNISSLRNLEFSLGISRATLESVASQAEAYYSPFPKEDRPRPFQRKYPPLKERIIDNPTEPLRTIQKRIQQRLLRCIDLPSYLCGGVKERSLMDNVTIHLGAPLIVTIDIKAFFPSVHNDMVYGVWTEALGCSAEIGALLTRLTTREHHLPLGASTSTMLANLVLSSVDGPIRRGCEDAAVQYSTWVDDLAFSGGEARKIIPIVVQTLKSVGFSVSRKKVKIMGPGTRKVLNGVLVGRLPNVLPERIKQLRSGIHKLREGEVPQYLREAYVKQLRSSIVQVGSINSLRSGRLLAEFEQVILKEAPRVAERSVLNMTFSHISGASRPASAVSADECNTAKESQLRHRKNLDR
jgi:RNA-directed DNA polymerase